jgi:hypothetical protein
MGAPLSPFTSFTKQPSGNITNPHGEPFDKGNGKVRIDLSYIDSKNLFDVSQRGGQDYWSFSNPGGGAQLQALKDVVRTSEVLIRGRIPASAIVERFS